MYRKNYETGIKDECVMRKMNYEVTIEADSEGDIPFECPSCGGEFKLKIDKVQNEDNKLTQLQCPYCRVVNEVNKFYIKEVMEPIGAIVQKCVTDEMDRIFGKISPNINSNDSIKVEYKMLEDVDANDDENGYITSNGYRTGSYSNECKIDSCVTEINSLTKGESWIVAGQWEFTINSVKETKERSEDSNENPEQVVYIDYSYKNLGYTDSYSDLWFTEINFTVIDEEGEVANKYSIFDENHLPIEIPVGAKCSNAKVAFALKNKSSQITIQVKEYRSNSDLYQEKVNFDIQVEG
ncbi:hypothetical protein CLOBY_35150 [Clostridium saccharobutylicum]|uniref:hypothetical protein n=1 Tax=Clostridium saccharobutylicum TaxID=169679 RepID=UPI000983F301|nr:hypothetical protein [Clostridium saccharobutylicum]AQS11359.1 hypothetical protein CLOBY_35150 [Clostridium saccharobutylicum]MBC2437982.1 DUF4352 domain-containing protein [Clostridium saccharobutylicum]NSB88756.1 putative C2H2 Zn-finger protein [Clostridium saccharobutylicum]NYC30666.1 putative C2H2 Zn-finger protein [Clostridium saccharobutylicum]OOM15449.1 hypothetical protein CLSAB_27190 [Clostridium saccharobutylicum]